jgi:hypothetical protein
MNKSLFFVLLPFVFFQSIHTMEHHLGPALIPNEKLEIRHHLDTSIPITWTSYDKQNKNILNCQQEYLNPTDTLFLCNQVWNVVSLVLPTSPGCVYFDIKQPAQPHLKNQDNNVHYGDVISIEQDKKNVSIYNLTTQQLVGCLPKENSSFCLGKKQYGYQPKKEFILWNINIPFLIVSIIAHKNGIKDLAEMTIKGSKFFRSCAESLSSSKGMQITMFSSEMYGEVVDSMVIIDIPGALQTIKIRSSCNMIQDNGVINIERTGDGYIVLSTMINQVIYPLAKICTVETQPMPIPCNYTQTSGL